MSHAITLRFRRELLPPPRQFYEAELGKLARPNREGWCAANCPFHRSKSRTSFAININHGGWVCRAGCGGGDIPGFVMLRDNCDFPTACKLLGAWVEDGKPAKVRPGPLVAYLAMNFTIDGIEYHASVLDEPKTELQRLRRFHAEASDRLTEVRNGDAEQFEGEEDVQRGILAASWALIQMEVGPGGE